MIDFFSILWNWITTHISLISDFSVISFLNHLLKILVAFFLAFPLALEREHHSRTLGLRTFPLVAVASCGYVLIAESFFIDDNYDPEVRARIMQGLMTGIGFIGGGAIMKKGKNAIIGTATAVSLWSTGTIGAAIAFNRLEIALVVAALNFILLRVLSYIKKDMKDSFED
jgi:putative Mg2+ transporter-C (MgtC) family protein